MRLLEAVFAHVLKDGMRRVDNTWWGVCAPPSCATYYTGSLACGRAWVQVPQELVARNRELVLEQATQHELLLADYAPRAPYHARVEAGHVVAADTAWTLTVHDVFTRISRCEMDIICYVPTN